MSARRLPLIAIALAAATLLGLEGCASGGLSGIGGSSDYACAAPPGVSCMSVTGIGVNAAKNNLPALRVGVSTEVGKQGDGDKKEETAPKVVAYNAAAPAGGTRVSPAGMDAPYSGQPLRTPPRVLRIWMAPFEDADNDLHDQKYLYVTVHTGRWLLEANQVNVQPQFKQVYPLARKDASDSDAATTAPQVDANGDPVAPENKVGATTKR